MIIESVTMVYSDRSHIYQLVRIDILVNVGQSYHTIYDNELMGYIPLFLPRFRRRIFLVVVCAAARSKNVGWRIDYFVVSERLCKCLESAKIYVDIMGNDHCPVEIQLKDC